MDVSIPPDLEAIRQVLRQFINSRLRPIEMEYIHAEDLPTKLKDSLQQEARSLGLWAMGVPEEYGGAGLGHLGMSLVYQEIAKVTIGHDVFGSTQPLLYAFLLSASEDIRQRYLVPVVDGVSKGATAMTEPNAGSDLGAIKTTASPMPGGYQLSGAKSFISGGADANFVVVLARLPGTQRKEGMTWFVVDTASEGFTVTRQIPVMGSPRPAWGPEIAEFTLTRCFVPEENVIGDVGRGFELAQNSLNLGPRLKVPAQCVGIAERCLEMACRHSNSRVLFGTSLANKQATQLAIADSYIELAAMRVMLYAAASRADAGQEISRDVAALKIFATEAAGRAVDRSLQLFGAMGYTKDLPLEKMYRDVRAMRIFDGTSEVLRLFVGKSVLSEYQ